MKEKIILIVRELAMTLSNKTSFLSSKRIERLIAFNSAMAIVWIYFLKTIDKITTPEVLSIAGLLLAHGTANALILRKEKKDEPTTPDPAA